MGPTRTLTAMEFLTGDGVRIYYDEDGWRVINGRQLGEKALNRARALLERCAECKPPVDPDALHPPTLEEIGLFVAKAHALRVTHRHFRKGR